MLLSSFSFNNAFGVREGNCSVIEVEEEEDDDDEEEEVSMSSCRRASSISFSLESEPCAPSQVLGRLLLCPSFFSS